MTIKKRPEYLGPQSRAVAFRDGSVNVEARTAELSFSSNQPIDMWYGTEILAHSAEAVRQSGARQQSMPLLFNHDANDLLGAVESIRIDQATGKGYATVRFGKDARGDWALSQVADRILTNVSFMYRVFKWEEDTEAETLTATDWEPYEISLVTVPADPSVGVGRSSGATENAVTLVKRSSTVKETIVMTDEEKKAAAAAAAGASAGGSNVVDIEVARKAAAVEASAGERKRITEINAMCRTHGLSAEFSDKLIADNASIDGARTAVLEEIAKRQKKQEPASGAGTGGPDMTDGEKREWSLTRAVNAALTGDWTRAGFEREVSQSIAKTLGKDPRDQRAFFMPLNIPFRMPASEAQVERAQRMVEMGQRAPYLVGTPAQGGNIVQTQLLYDNFIEVLRNQSVTAQLGATILSGLVGNVNIPRQNAATATYWVAESGAPTEAEVTFDQVQLRPKTVAALSKMSRLMLLQSTPAIEQIARQDLLAQIILGIDLAAISGSGASNQPTGIVNQAGVGSVVGGANGANWTFDNFIQLYSAPRVANAPQASLGYAINAKTYGYLSTLKATTGQYLWMPQGGITQAPGDQLRGYRYAVSNQLRSNLTKGTSAGICSEAVFGNWQELIIGEWGTLEIAVNPYDSTGFTTGDVLIRAFQTIDIGVRHPVSFAVMSDGLTPGF